MIAEKKLFVRNGYTYKVYAPEDLRKRWFVQWYDGGKRYRRYGEVNTHSTYDQRMAAALRLVDLLTVENAPRVTGTQVKIEAYLESRRHGWRASTLQQNQSIVNCFFEWMDHREPTAELCREFFVWLRSNRHATTYNKYLMHLRMLFDGIGAYGRLVGIEKLKNEKTPARYFQRHQIDQLAEYLQENDTDLWRFVQFVYYCFIRPRELRQLQAGDVMLEEERILIPGTKSKNKKTQYVIIPDPFLPQLQWVRDLPPGAFLFPSYNDPKKPVGRNTMTSRHREILRKLHFGTAYTLYSWKHTGAVMAAKAGNSIKELQIQLRHHSLDETDKYLRQMGVSDLVRLKKNFPGI